MNRLTDNAKLRISREGFEVNEGGNVIGAYSHENARADRGLLVVADSDLSASRCLAEAEIAGVRVLGRAGWPDAAHRISAHVGGAVVLLEMSSAPEVMLEGQLPAIELAAAAQGMPLIACFDRGQIDLAASLLSSEGATLLCDSTAAERAAAIAVAVAVADDRVLHDPFRENDTARLARLNDEVARIAEVLNRLNLRGSEAAAIGRGDVADRRQAYGGAPLAADAAKIDPADIRKVIRARRMRDQIVGEGLFEDPAWDMLLDLFAAHLERTQVSVSSLCIAAAVAPTTALRWIGKLTAAGLIERNPDPFDRRRVFMALTPDSLAKMRAYVAALVSAGLPIV